MLYKWCVCLFLNYVITQLPRVECKYRFWKKKALLDLAKLSNDLKHLCGKYDNTGTYLQGNQTTLPTIFLNKDTFLIYSAMERDIFINSTLSTVEVDNWSTLDDVYLVLTSAILVIGSIGNLMVIGAVLSHKWVDSLFFNIMCGRLPASLSILK